MTAEAKSHWKCPREGCRRRATVTASSMESSGTPMCGDHEEYMEFVRETPARAPSPHRRDQFLTAAQKRKYVKHPDKCPYCGARRIANPRFTEIAEDTETVSIGFRCSNDKCDRRWTATYVLHTILGGDPVLPRSEKKGKP